MFIELAPDWNWLERFEKLTRCADSLDELRLDVLNPQRPNRSPIPVAGRLDATLAELEEVTTSPDVRAASSALRVWLKHGGGVETAAVFTSAVNGLRVEARAIVKRRPEAMLRAALLYQLAAIVDNPMGSALSENDVAGDFGAEMRTVERWVSAAHERGDIEILGFEPPVGRTLRITSQGLETLEASVRPHGAADAAGRQKSEKHGILDSPALLKDDLARPPGPLGMALIYLDIDDFKPLNTRFTETVVDRTILATFQGMVGAFAQNNGYAYAEGGDEVVVLLPNATEEMAVAFVTAAARKIGEHTFEASGEQVRLTISAGLASSERFPADQLKGAANRAERRAKDRGKNCIVVEGR